mmetsp:Transcript_5546/g.14486  ORF Transcript_5546/g.14486 Transcript_5546/m.14486 type:complete len:298 (+) Transcript_5546:689-1582(+)
MPAGAARSAPSAGLTSASARTRPAGAPAEAASLAHTSSAVVPSDVCGALKSFTATGAELPPGICPTCTTPLVPAPRGRADGSTPSSAWLKEGRAADPVRRAAGNRAGLPASASQARRGSSSSQGGICSSRLLERRTSSNRAHAAIEGGSAATWLLASISLISAQREPPASPRSAGRPSMRFSVRMSHSSEGGSTLEASVPWSRFPRNASMRSCDSARSCWGSSVKRLLERKSIRNEGGSGGSAHSSLPDASSLRKFVNSMMPAGKRLSPQLLSVSSSSKRSSPSTEQPPRTALSLLR